MTPTTLFLTRHASILWNEERRFQGSLDSPLSSKGQDQARLLGRVIADLHPVALCTSTLSRTKETGVLAMESAELTLPTETYPELNEISLGSWEGKTVAWVKEHDGEAFEHYTQRPHTFKHPTGEGFCDVLDRALSGIERIVERYKGKRVWVITHGFVLCALLVYLRNIPFEYYASKMRVPDNAEVIHTTWFR